MKFLLISCVLSEWLSHFATIIATADAFYNEMREFFEKFIQCIRKLVNKKFIKRLRHMEL